MKATTFRPPTMAAVFVAVLCCGRVSVTTASRRRTTTASLRGHTVPTGHRVLPQVETETTPVVLLDKTKRISTTSVVTNKTPATTPPKDPIRAGDYEATWHIPVPKTKFVQHGCTSYYNTGYAHRPPDIPYSDGYDMATRCSDACDETGFEYFGFECPMADRVHCQCYRPTKTGGTKPVEAADCHDRVGRDGEKHCTGPAMLDGISLGGADMGSMYKVGAVSMDGLIDEIKEMDDNSYYDTGKEAVPCCSSWCPVHKEDSPEYCDYCMDHGYGPGCTTTIRGAFDYNSNDRLCDADSLCEWKREGLVPDNWGETSTEDCPEGYAPILEATVCRTEADRIGYTMHAPAGMDWIPAGCSFRRNQNQYYFNTNTAATSRGNRHHAPVCHPVCTEDAKVCWDGVTVLTRDPTDNCNWPEWRCPQKPPEPQLSRCQGDVQLLKTIGTAEYPSNAVEINAQTISATSDTVSVNLKQQWTNAPIDHIFASYRTSVFDQHCYESTDVRHGESFETITIACDYLEPRVRQYNNGTKYLTILTYFYPSITNSYYTIVDIIPILFSLPLSSIIITQAFLEICVADNVDHNVLSIEDNATIPKCCHPNLEPNTPVVCYSLEISCEPCETLEMYRPPRNLLVGH